MNSKVIYKRVMTVLLIGCSCLHVRGQNIKDYSSKEKLSMSIIKKQLDGYNNRNIKKFLNQYSDSIKVYNFIKGISITGKNQMESIYKNLFENNPDLKRKIANTIVKGSTVITNELVTLVKGYTDKVITIYAIEDGKIQEVYYVGSD
jgi:hypothetical protein